MFLSKIWFILVAILAGVAFGVALTAPRPMAQKLEDLEGQRLDRAQYAAEQMLKVDAHKWIDRVANLGRDLVISDALDSASRGSGELSVQHKTIQGRLRALLPDLAGAGIATMGAVDANGRAVARIGDEEKDYGDSIGGAEIISDALRGYLSDDVWGNGGQVLRVAAAPVLSKTRDRVVGALYVGADTGKAFAERLAKNLDVDVALLLMGKVVASTLDSRALSMLPEMVAQHRAEIDDVKRTPALPFELGDDTYLAVAAPFPGQVSEQQGYYVVIGKKPVKADLGSLLAATSARDLRWASFPWISLVGAMLALIAIGLLLQRYEIEWPIDRMRSELRRLAQGEIARLDDHRFGGHFGGIARDINATLEHAHASTSQVGVAAADAAGTARPPDWTGGDGGGGGAGAGAGVVGNLFGSAPPSGSGPGTGDEYAPPPPPPPGFAPPGPGGFPAHLPSPAFSLPGAAGTAAASTGTQAATALGGVRILPRTPPAPPSTAAAVPPLPGMGAAGPLPSPGSAVFSDPTRTDVDDDDELHVRTVFDEFIAAKQQCGESVAGLTLDKFRLRLQENRNSLMARHACRTVRFAVYVKDGKASLRASPIK